MVAFAQFGGRMTEEMIDGRHTKKSAVLTNILAESINPSPREILVVGCGSGAEAGILARAFRANTVGIDLGEQFNFDHIAAEPAKLLRMDARNLEFAENTFDLVYSFHSLEHIPTPEKALMEMARVLRPGGTYLIGTPNKSRLLGYIGTDEPIAKKIVWNLNDLKMRFTGRWSNEKGAHAGFKESELVSMCARAFSDAPAVLSDQYYRRLYRTKTAVVEFLIKSGAKAVIYPCVYVLGRNIKDRGPDNC
jgi:ubiquinone/menaquinone biosynthesis C-methylase UbiE